MVSIVDPNNLAPKELATELDKCLGLLPFEFSHEIIFLVEEHNTESNALAWNGVDYWMGKPQMAVKLFARDIDAEVKYNRINYWLFIALHELIHIHYRHQQPASVLDDLEGKCNAVAHDILQAYKQRYT